jgi:hypothetical protein
MKPASFFPWFCLPICVICGSSSAAGELPNPVYPVTYSTPSPDGKFLFVMLAPPSGDPAKDPDNTPRGKELRKTYPRSGLYRNDGSTDPVWAVDWYAYGVYPANDGVHLVREDSPARMLSSFISGKRLADATVAEQLDGPALSFLAGGKVLKSYTVRELIAKPDELPQSVTHVLWMSDGIVTKDGKRFVLMTQDSQQIVFDLATGEVVSRKQAGLGNVQVWVVRGLMAFIALFLAAAFARWLYFARKGTAG